MDKKTMELAKKHGLKKRRSMVYETCKEVGNNTQSYGTYCHG